MKRKLKNHPVQGTSRTQTTPPLKTHSLLARMGRLLLYVSLPVTLALSVFYASGVSHPSSQLQTPPIARKALRVSYTEAQRSVSLRQEYLDSLLEGISIPNSAGVLYDNDGLKVQEYISRSIDELISVTGMSPADAHQRIKITGADYTGGKFYAVTIGLPFLSGKGRKIPTYIGRELFEKNTQFTDEDRRNIIGAHEGRHVHQASVGSFYLSQKEIDDGLFNGSISPDVDYALCEMDANSNALMEAEHGKFILSTSYYRSTKNECSRYRSFLQNALVNSSPLQRVLIINALRGTGDLR